MTYSDMISRGLVFLRRRLRIFLRWIWALLRRQLLRAVYVLALSATLLFPGSGKLYPNLANILGSVKVLTETVCESQYIPRQDISQKTYFDAFCKRSISILDKKLTSVKNSSSSNIFLSLGFWILFVFALGVIFPRLATALFGFTFIVVIWAVLFAWAVSGWRPVTLLDFSLFGLRSALLIIFTWFIPRLLFLLIGFVRQSLRGPKYSNDYRDVPYPLPYQIKAVEELKAALNDERYNNEPITVSLRGTWGSGKTTCINQLRKELGQTRKDRKTAFVYINVWPHETDPLPELAIYREIAGKWEIIFPWGWRAVPAVRLLLSYTSLILKLTWNLGKAQTQIDGNITRNTPPSVIWQTHLKTLVKACGKQVVVVLDDIDRCSPVTAQRFVTLVRRFLFVPKVAIIIPYVEEQLRYKVFNPLIAVLPDIAGTIEAVLNEAFGGKFRIAKEEEEEEEEGLNVYVTTRNKPDSGPRQRNEPGNYDGTVIPATLPTSAFSSSVDGVLRQLRDHLINKFFEAPDRQRERIFTLCEEKYLSDRIVTIEGLTKKDFAEIVTRHWGVIEWSRKLKIPMPDLSDPKAIKKWLDSTSPEAIKLGLKGTRRELIEKTWGVWEKQEKTTSGTPSLPSIRQVRAVLGTALASFHDDDTGTKFHDDDERKKYFIIKFVALLYLAVKFSKWRIDVGEKE